MSGRPIKRTLRRWSQSSVTSKPRRRRPPSESHRITAQPPLAKINSERDNPMNWSDIFTAPAALYACHVAVVRVPVAVQLMQTSQPRCHRSRGRTNTNRLPDQQRMAQAPGDGPPH